MSNKVIRYQIADYLSPVPGENGSESYALMGAGFSSLDENPSATVDKTAFINDKSASGSITGYEVTFPFDTQLIYDEAAIAQIYDIARNQRTGGEAEAYYVRVELFKGESGTAFPARRFKVAVEVTSVSGAGTEIVRVAGNLHQVGNFEDGTFDTSTKAFTKTATNVASY